jgi:uncharacterized membrane protein YeaQ/YmgE (transglycosylase-associated protein family)
MHLLWTLIIGLIIGAVAKLLMPRRDPGGFIVTIAARRSRFPLLS